uniref:Phospholipase-like protein n=1 Tax=Tanacetum cinerariifolium TaxID=118510 RepID=A0A6L2NF21_TANCI|nr:phospholipase-like protein [Tanacetum cinerariifolium]
MDEVYILVDGSFLLSWGLGLEQLVTDAICVCLLLCLEVIFMDRLLVTEVDDILIRLVDSLESWNAFPWESFKRSHRWWNKVFEAIPKRIGWSKKAVFIRSDYHTLFCKDSNPIVDLRPTLAEYKFKWWASTNDYLTSNTNVPRSNISSVKDCIITKLNSRIFKLEAIIQIEDYLVEEEFMRRLEEEESYKHIDLWVDYMCYKHIDLWVDYMWYVLPDDANWAMVSTYLPWTEADKVFTCFRSINEPGQHWCLAEFDIVSGVVTFYDNGDSYDLKCCDWYIWTRDFLQVRLLEVLELLNVLDKK